MTPEQYMALARQSGATVYTNRHYPLRPAVSFSYPAWLKFCELLEKPTPNTLSVVTDDPCSGCKPGTACRTPSCGRLSKMNLAKASEIGHRVDQAIKAWDDHETLTFHPLEHNGGKTGWPPGLLQDDDRKLSKWFASRPDALYVLRKNLSDRLPDENNRVAIDRACFDRGCACFDPRIDKDFVLVEKRP